MMTKKTRLILGTSLLVALLLSACNKSDSPSNESTPVESIVVTDTPSSSSADADTVPTARDEELTTLVAPNPTAVESGFTPEELVIAANIDAADVEAGSALFNRTLRPACVECHIDDGNSRPRGPSLVNFRDVAGTRVAGQDAYTYAYNSIRYANDFVLDGYEADVMRVYDGILTDQEVYELIAYIWTLEDDE